MLRKTLIALVVATLGAALVSTDASARAGFRVAAFIASGSLEVCGAARIGVGAGVGAAQDWLGAEVVGVVRGLRRPGLAWAWVLPAQRPGMPMLRPGVRVGVGAMAGTAVGVVVGAAGAHDGARSGPVGAGGWLR